MFIIIIISFIGLTGIFSLRERLRKRRTSKKEEIEELIDKYAVEEKKSVLRQKLASVFDLITKTEEYLERIVKRKVKFYEDDYVFTKKERNLIKKAKSEYNSFFSEFRTALPKTEEQRLIDMKELESVISMLESFDAETFEDKEKIYDAGTGMFYDKMSRKFIYIIDENNLTDYGYIPIQRIKYHAFSTIKNIRDEDFMPVLNIMKETNLINDIVEINPQFQIIVFTEEKKLDLTIPEKVLLSFAYEEELLTVEKLIELTEWKQSYANSVIEGLQQKGMITIDNNKIIIENFGTSKERREWNIEIQNKIKQEKEKEEKKHKKQLERAAQMQQKLAKKKEIKISEDPVKEEVLKEIKFKEKPSVKDLALLKKDVEISEEPIKHEQKIKNEDELTSAIEALDEIMPMDTPISEDLEKEMGEPQNIQDLIAKEILNYHEKYSLINGGFSQYEKIKHYIDEILKGVPEDLLKRMIEQLKGLELIFDSIKIGSHDYYLFSDISLTEDEKKFIEFATNKKPMIKEDFIRSLNWDEARISTIIQQLQDKKIVRLELGYIIIHGIIQNE